MRGQCGSFYACGVMLMSTVESSACDRSCVEVTQAFPTRMNMIDEHGLDCIGMIHLPSYESGFD